MVPALNVLFLSGLQCKSRMSVKTHFFQLLLNNVRLHFCGVKENINISRPHVDFIFILQSIMNCPTAHETHATMILFIQRTEEFMKKFIGFFYHQFFHHITAYCPAILPLKTAPALPPNRQSSGGLPAI